MASGLSSNWKRLQTQLQQGSDKPQEKKRKVEDRDDTFHKSPSKPSKKAKLSTSPRPTATPKHPVVKGKSKKSTTVSKMGAAQSQPSKHITSSPALWTTTSSSQENTTTTSLSPEEISEAYNLGTKDLSLLHAEPPRPNEGLSPQLPQIGKYIALDCEMVGVGEGGYAHALARVSLVDFHGRQVYDSYVRPRERVTDWRTRVSGIEPKHMACARDFDQVRTQVAALFQGRVLVGHDLKHDLEVLMLEHPSKAIRDTAKFAPFKKYGHGPKPALKVLAREILGVEIQTGQHSSLEDARAAMLLFRRHKPAFDVDIANRYPDSTPRCPQSKAKTKQKKTKKKRRN